MQTVSPPLGCGRASRVEARGISSTSYADNGCRQQGADSSLRPPQDPLQQRPAGRGRDAVDPEVPGEAGHQWGEVGGRTFGGSWMSRATQPKRYDQRADLGDPFQIAINLNDPETMVQGRACDQKV